MIDASKYVEHPDDSDTVTFQVRMHRDVRDRMKGHRRVDWHRLISDTIEQACDQFDEAAVGETDSATTVAD